MRTCIIVGAVLIALASLAGCTSSSCTIPSGVPFTTEITINESTANNCPADLVAALEGVSQSTMTFDSAQSCSNVELAFQLTDPSSSATCTATGAAAFTSFQTGSGSGNGGSGNGSVEVTCSDGTTCLETIAVTLMETD